MNTSTYEQLSIPSQVVGSVGQYLKENAQIQVEFYKGSPISILFPRTVELKVSSCPPGIHDGTDGTFKEVTLENGARVLVPQFIRKGDVLKIEVESGKYVDRIKK
jgi:elongation factor P